VKIELRDPESLEDWTESGSWFKSFVELGVTLAKQSLSPTFDVSRLLIMAPKREYVSAAIAFGFSVEKFLSAQSIAREISVNELESLPPGTILRLEWPTYIRDVAFESHSTREIGGQVVHYARVRVQESIKNLDLRRVTRVSLLPDGFPQGHHPLTDNPDGPPLSPRRTLWEGQASPALAIFGDVGHFQEQISSQIRYEAFSSVLGIDTMTLGHASRVDFITNDFAHFINLFEQVSAFPRAGSWAYKVFELCDWVLLDGNNATSKLSAKEALAEKKVISLVEIGVPRSQGKALDAYLSELNDFRAIDAGLKLNWKPPTGVQLWGWAS
jgi:hypothetical protein